jgi:alcohol-forming fatty acyl-CoA reductase
MRDSSTITSGGDAPAASPDSRPSAPAGGKPRTAAYCDIDGTLADTSIVHPLIYMKRHCLAPVPSMVWQVSLLLRGPWWWLLDQYSRRSSNLAIYANYRGISEQRLRAMAGEYYARHIKPKLFPSAVERLEHFRKHGHLLVFVTGGLDVFVEPLGRDLGAECISPKLAVRNGVFTGSLTTDAFTGALKADAILKHAGTHGIDLRGSYGLGDAIGDLAMLEAVGNPIAVNPDRRLAKVAAQRGWRIEQWRK